MKKFIKLLSLVLVCFMAVAVLCACGETDNNADNNEETKAEHTHKAADGWNIDKDNHWHQCEEDSEIIDVAPHTLEKNICTVCGAGIIKDGDNVSVYFYDKNNNWVRRVNYSADDTFTEDTAEYTYDDNNNILTLKITIDGKVASESEYGVDETGYNYEQKITQYFEDGTKLYNEYSVEGDTLRETKYNKDGSVEYDHKTVHEYDENGKKKSEKTYDGDRLIQEVKYILVTADSWGGGIYNREVTTYNEDGTIWIVIYNENGEVVDATN